MELPAGGALIAASRCRCPRRRRSHRFGYGDVEWQVSARRAGGGRTGFWLRTPEGDAAARHAGGARRAQRAQRRRGDRRPARGGRASSRPTQPPPWPSSPAPAAASSCAASVAASIVVDDYAHHPTEVAATHRGRPRHGRRAAWWSASSRTCSRAPRRWRATSVTALAAADEVVRDRDLPGPRVSRSRASPPSWWWTPSASARPGMPLAYAADLDAAPRVPARADPRRATSC